MSTVPSDYSSLPLPRGRICGDLRVPSSKSEMLRLLLLVIPWEEDCVNFRCTPPCADVLSLMRQLVKFGQRCDYGHGDLAVRGGPWRSMPDAVQCGESGFLARTWPFLFSGMEAVPSIEGSGTLLERGQADLMRLLRSLSIEGELTQGRLPLRMAPYRLPDVVDVSAYDGQSSQPVSGLLIGLARTHRDFEVYLGSWADNGYVRLTLSSLQRMGYEVVEANGLLKVMRSDIRMGEGTSITVEGDWSAAAMLIATAVLSGGCITLKGLLPHSLQPDRRVLDVLNGMGVPYRWDVHGLIIDAPDAMAERKGAAYRSFVCDIEGSPDLAVPLAALAVACRGESRIGSTHLLRGKESDRAEGILRILRAFGVSCSLQDNSLCIMGGKLRGGFTLEASADHRLAMLIAALALRVEGEVYLEDADCVEKSYPTFWADLRRLIPQREP